MGKTLCFKMDLTIEHMTVSESNLKPSTHLLHVFIIFFRIDNFNHTAEYYISANVQLRFNVFAFVIPKKQLICT